VTFTRQDGTVGASFELVANTVRFLSPREEGGNVPPDGDMESAPASEDIPF
jgi:hypothetical protein